MNFRKPLCRYLSTVALADFLVACAAWYGNRLPSLFSETVFLLLMLPGGIFLLGMACGVIWGGARGLRPGAALAGVGRLFACDAAAFPAALFHAF